MVLADLTERQRLGIARYGTTLQPHNGRDALVDAYQEALDLALYLRQAIAEQDEPAPSRESAEYVARHFHEAYERLAPTFDYRTRQASAKPWEQVPDDNRNLMVAVAAELLARGVITAGPDSAG
jgi:hypothetical protein